jgi:glutamate synthase (NADPH) large chain
VVLGPTGRNFAAGMSGGRAFVWRLDPELVNRELVDLDEPNEVDASALRALIEAHLAETGSAVAGKLLADWPASADEFTVVTPREYKAALAKQAKTAAANHSDSSELAVANA